MARPDCSISVMKLSEKVKLGLDETRMLILGAQILLGFELRGAFQDGFETLPAHSRYLEALALGFMVCTVALLIAPGPYHRIVEEGEDSGPLHQFVTLVADLALLPLALALGLDIAVVAERIFGRLGGMLAGGTTALLALAFWYAMPRLRARSYGAREREQTMRHRQQREHTPINQKIDQMLTEARVILPGAQAMLGFQLAIVLTRAFEQLAPGMRFVRAASLGLVALAVILLMAPAPYHRIVYAGEDNPDMHRVGSLLVTAATLPLALGIAGDVYVVISKIVGPEIGLIGGVLAIVLLLGLWYAFPLAARWSGAGAKGQYQGSPAE
jgi:uncharacterized protein DUF6328